MTLEINPTQPSSRVFSRQSAPLSIAIVLTTSLVAFEGLSISIALPEIGVDMQVTEHLPWIVTAYLLSSALALALAGSVIDHLGPRQIFRWATFAFTVFSALCAISSNTGLLIAARAFQGFAGGTIIATSGAAIGLGYPADLRSRVYALAASVWGVLAVTGPAIAAALLLSWGWRSIFAVNVPLAMLAFALGWRAMPQRAAPDRGSQPARLTVDVRGALLIASLLVAGLMALSKPSPTTWVWLPAASLLAGLYWRHSGRATSPLLQRRYFARPPFRDLALTAGLVMAAGMGVETYLPLYLRGARGASTTLAAWSVLFLAAGWTVSANIASRLYHRLPETRIATLGPIAMVPILALVGLAIWTEAPLAILFFLYFTMGLAIGMTTNACLTLVQQRAADHEIGRATAAHQFLRNLSVTYGTAAAGATVITWATSGIAEPDSLHRSLLDPGGGLGALGNEGLAIGFAAAHGIGLTLALAAVFAALRVGRQQATNKPTVELATPGVS